MAMRRRALLLFFFLFLLSCAAPACVREGAAVLAPVDTAELGDAGPPSALLIAATPPLAHDQCTARLRASTIKTAEGCTLDERISKNNGVLLYPCSGDGPFEAVFGEHRFSGTVSAGILQLALTTELDWDDGCHWETQQAIRGEWRRDHDRDRKPAKLVWTYEEHPVNGVGCFGSCKARADVELDELTQ
jgi:hypothetical protein